MKHIVIVISDGVLQNVYTDGDPAEIAVDLIDYDNIEAISDDKECGEAIKEANDIEERVKNGTLKSCW